MRRSMARHCFRIAASVALFAAFAPLQPSLSQGTGLSEESQNADALLRLADLYSDTRTEPVDLPKAYGYYLKAAEAGSVDARLRVAEMLLRGQGVARDVEKAQALIDDLVVAGDTATLVRVGDFYRTRVRVLPGAADKALEYHRMAAGNGSPQALVGIGDTLALINPNEPDSAAIIAAYTQAAETGDVEAVLRLGDAYHGGEVIAADQSRAFSYYARAEAMGSETGALMIAEMLIAGQGVLQDAARGLSALQDLAHQGSTRALMSIANAMASGAVGPIDAKSVIGAYEDAAAQGLVDAWLRLGDLYSDGILVRRDRKRALAAYQQAADLGNPWGLYALGAGYLDGDFGKAGSPETGLKLLRQAEAAGMSDATVAIADAQIFGDGTRADPQKGLALLEEAAEMGNAAAASRLIAIHRDGIFRFGNRIIRADREKARMLLHRFAPLYDRGGWLYEQALLEASAGEDAFNGDAILAVAGELSPRRQMSLMRRLLAINENAYVYVAQSQLKRIGLFDGEVDGLLTRATIHAMNDFCARTNTELLCRFGPATAETAKVMAALLWSPTVDRIAASDR